MKYLITLMTFIFGFSLYAQDVTLDNMEIKNKLSLRKVFPKPDNHKKAEKAGDVYFMDYYNAPVYHNGTKVVMLNALKTIEVSSANLLAGDSIMILNPVEDGVKILPVLVHAFYEDGITYTTAASDSSCIYTYSNGIKTKIVYIADSFVTGTYNTNSSVNISETSSDTGAAYWLDLKNYDDGTGTLTINFFYIRHE